MILILTIALVALVVFLFVASAFAFYFRDDRDEWKHVALAREVRAARPVFHGRRRE